MNTTGDSNSQALDAALAWISRLRADSASEADRQAFALWLHESSTHRHAMDEAESLWGDLGSMLKAQALAIDPPRRRWIPSAVAVAATLLLAIGFWAPGFWTPDSDSPGAQQFRTAKGERLEVSLPDGSQALLNTDTVIRVTYSEAARRVELRRGQAWFSVRENSRQPFHVDAGKTRVTALGTAFDVYRGIGATEITVTEGVVRVSEMRRTGSRAPNAEILHRNQYLRAAPSGWEVEKATEESVHNQLAWREGRLVARGMPLQELIVQLERYHATTYLLGSPGLASLAVSGVFDLDQPQSILRAIEVSLDLEARQLDGKTVQLVKPQ